MPNPDVRRTRNSTVAKLLGTVTILGLAMVANEKGYVEGALSKLVDFVASRRRATN